MTINDLLEVYDPNRELECQELQICNRENCNWDECDTFLTTSSILSLLGEQKIVAMGAVSENCIRVEIDGHNLKTPTEWQKIVEKQTAGAFEMWFTLVADWLINYDFLSEEQFKCMFNQVQNTAECIINGTVRLAEIKKRLKTEHGIDLE